ncbi:Transcriptional regulator prz1 [Mycena indigotica]|uniref:Transcriptional regulator prz1 n=1 Tax=Mycena indigotica TaxID=2126181 RepID=A0A8H6SCC0_9AGAR|nr:Transcriptional regulator prz1 [Mycena indigotica]KAF7296930.1 Transcriptional regulator prz1 [Mycena indigotica]
MRGLLDPSAEACFRVDGRSPMTSLSPAASTSTLSSNSAPSSVASPLPAGSRRKRPTTLHCSEDDCTRSFTSQYTLMKHVKAHERKEKKYFPCSMGCDMRFSRKHDRLRHEVTQHGRVCEWGCPVCLGFFSSESTLTKHKCKATAGSSRWSGP